MSKPPLMLTANPKEYFKSYFIKNHPIKHHARCQTAICIEAREENRVATRNRYEDGKYRFCSACETPFESRFFRCPCCSHMLRKRSKYSKTKEQQITRY